jgi:gamma-glutamyltranspeptidase / glutathione hydrolase
MSLVPAQNTYASSAMVVSVDGLATMAAVEVLRRGGSAVDAAIAANAVLGVTLPNQCGVGGDLFALVHRPGADPSLLEAAGRSGSGADPERLRARGLTSIPPDDVVSVTIPGCVDGWTELHDEYGRLPMSDLLAAAIDYARNGFPATPFLARTISKRPDVAREIEGADGGVQPGSVLRRKGVARVLTDIADGGREAFYEGEFGAALRRVGDLFTVADLRAPQARWTSALATEAFGSMLWTTQPPAAGYLTLAAAWIADHLPVPVATDDPQWAHLLIEAMRQAAFDRSDVLADGSDGAALIAPDRLSSRAEAIRPDAVASLGDGYRVGGTTYVAVVDSDRLAVSLIQSNCMSFGSGIVAADTGIWLQNRGIGFTLRPDHPNTLAPGRRPAHTLAPMIVTDVQRRLQACVGTRGGDSQPQILFQLLARILRAGELPASALAAGRWMLRGADDDTSFNTWGSRGAVRVCLEGNAPSHWVTELADRGHVVEVEGDFSHAFGHAHAITVSGDTLVAAGDPRSGSAMAAGF